MKRIKNRSLNMLIVGMLVLCALSVTLAVFLYEAHEEFDDRIVVNEDGVTESIIPVRDLMLVPTETKEYSVDFFCAASGTYEFDVSYVETEDGGMKSFVNVTSVTFYPLSDAEIDAYVATKDPMDKAGAYGIQGVGSVLVQKIDGDFFSVMGLPVAELHRVLQEME